VTSPDRPRQARAERTRAEIIEVAAAAFAAGGYDGVSMNDLVRASGLTKGAFYFHFASKDDLALATFRAKQAELIAKLAAGADDAAEAPSAAARLRDLLLRRAALLRADPSLRVVSRLGSDLNVRFGPGSEYASFLDLAHRLIVDLVTEGQRSAELRADLDPAAAARAIFAWIVGLDTVSLLTSGGDDLEARSAEVLDLLLHGLLATSPPRRPRSTAPTSKPQHHTKGPAR